MKSKLWAKLPIEKQLLQHDISLLEKECFVSYYSEFKHGDWGLLSLANSSGKQDDVKFKLKNSNPIFTNAFKKLSYLRNLIDSNFNMERINMIRISNLQKGVIFPHRDFVENKTTENFIRLLIPLKTNRHALHYESNSVFNMRIGEIWQLFSKNIHSACNLENISRLILILDFDTSDIKNCIKNTYMNEIPLPINFKYREQIGKKRICEYLHDLSSRISKDNFKEIFSEISLIPYKVNISVSNLFQEFALIFAEQAPKEMYNKYIALQKYLLEDRQANEKISYY